MSLNKKLLAAPSIHDAWRLYESYVLPKDAPPIQRSETNRSFVAGIDWVLKRMIHAAEDESAAEDLLSRLLEECYEFADRLTEN